MARTVRVTREGFERLKRTLAQEYERLEEATTILRDLTGTSDDYDDTGLEEAKREKANIEERIENLEAQLDRAEILETHEDDRVDLGSVVTLQDTANKEAFEVQVVSSIEAGVLDTDIPRVSDESPLGKALMGRKPGDAFEVEIRERKQNYTVVSIG